MTPRRNSIRPRRRVAVVEPAPLLQFVVLSMLLHVLIIVLFGNPTGGTRRNEGDLGPLDVMLPRLAPESGSEFILAPGSATNGLGSSPQPAATEAATALAPHGTAQPPLARPASGEALPRLNPSAAEEVDKPLAAHKPAAVKLEPSVLLQRQPELAPAVKLPPQAVPVLPATPIERAVPPSSERELSPPVEVPPRVAPTAPTAPTAPLERYESPMLEPELTPPAPLAPPALPTLPKPIERTQTPSSEPQLSSPVEIPPQVVPAAPTAPLERSESPVIERQLEPATPLSAREAPAAPAPPLERATPPKIERDIAPPVELPLPAVPVESPVPGAPVALPLSGAPLERLAPAGAERTIAPPEVVPAPRAERLAPGVAPAAGPPTPQRGGPSGAEEDLFKPRRDVGTPSTEAPRIDFEAAGKKAAREIVSEGAGARGIFTVPAPPERKKETSPLEKSVKPDCRTAYANMGLLAVPVLVASAIAADGSCRW